MVVVGLATADSAVASDDGDSDASSAGPSSTEMRLCAPPVAVGPIPPCYVEV